MAALHRAAVAFGSNLVRHSRCNKFFRGGSPGSLGSSLLQVVRREGSKQRSGGGSGGSGGAPAWLVVLALLGWAYLGFQRWGSEASPVLPRLPAAGGLGGRRQLGPARFPAPQLRTLVLVACHSVFTGLSFEQAELKSSWYLLEYQRDVPGQVHSFVEHIQLGVQEAAADPAALLLFSGGKTRRGAGPRAEGEGYWLVAEAAGWYGHPSVRERTFTEDHARDSLENLLFGLCRFFELTGHYPASVTMVGYKFKEQRFLELHRAALRFPLAHMRYVGTPALDPGAVEGEARTAAAFQLDSYGCSEELQAKRAQRDPFASGGPTGGRCPAMAELLLWCGPDVFDGPLPWDNTV